ncbi:MAG: putative RNA polymerase sigma factor, partial [uncultured Solirubrobacteraceae bacterium]
DVDSRAGRARAQGASRRGVHPALPGTSARRLLLRLLPGRQPSRRRGPHHPDLPAGLSPLRARARGVRRAAAAALAHPDRPQPGGQPLSRPLAAPADLDGGRRAPGRPALHRVPGRAARRARAHPRLHRRAARRPPRGADHALRARHGQPRDRTGARPQRRGHQGPPAPRHPAAGEPRVDGRRRM